MPGIIRQLGTPSRPSRPRGYYKGRQKGDKVQKATRHKTIYKAKKKTKPTTQVV